MKKFVNFIFNFLKKLVLYLFLLLFIFIIYTWIFSTKSNIPFETTLSYFKSLGTEILGFKAVDTSITNVGTNNNPNINDSEIIASSNTNYYYEQLDNTGKTIYTTLENNIDNFKKENYVIDFSTTFNDLLHETTGQYKLNKSFQSALDAFFYDHTELFYIDLTKITLNIKCISLGSFKTYTVEITPKDNKNYLNSSFNSEEDVNIAISKVEKVRNNIISSVSNKNVYDKIKLVHDMLVNSIEYDTTLSKQNIHNIYGALIEQEVVCEGYAKAFKYIMDSANIECILVSGPATNSSNQTESHMWNYVKLNDDWYGVDLTWDDPIIDGSSRNNIRHDYLLKGFNTFVTTHNPSGKISDVGMLFTLPNLANKNYKY